MNMELPTWYKSWVLVMYAGLAMMFTGMPFLFPQEPVIAFMLVFGGIAVVGIASWKTMDWKLSEYLKQQTEKEKVNSNKEAER